MMEWWLAYLAIGLAVGFFAGLLGIGGGAVMVPMLVLVFHAQGLPEQHIMHIALGTAMATIMFTSIASSQSILLPFIEYPIPQDFPYCKRFAIKFGGEQCGLRLAGRLKVFVNPGPTLSFNNAK